MKYLVKHNGYVGMVIEYGFYVPRYDILKFVGESNYRDLKEESYLKEYGFSGIPIEVLTREGWKVLFRGNGDRILHISATPDSPVSLNFRGQEEVVETSGFTIVSPDEFMEHFETLPH